VQGGGGERVAGLPEQVRRGVLSAGAAVAGATALEVRRRLRTGGGWRALVPDADLLRHSAARVTTPLLPDDYLHLVNPLWTARELRGRVDRVVPETDDVATLVIRSASTWTAPGTGAPTP